METNGWIKLHRKLLENPIIRKPTYLALWVYILLKANHKDKKFMWNGDMIIVKEGQILTGRKELSMATDIPETSVERILDFLEKQCQIGQQKTTKFRLITVINWKTYQNTDNKRTTNGQQTDTNKNVKNVKNEKNINTTAPSAEIQKVFEVFAEYNPTINWGNTTSRKAASDLIKRFGLEKTLAMARQVIAIQGKKYAPVATTPYQLKEKLAQFRAYFEAEKNKKPKVGIV